MLGVKRFAYYKNSSVREGNRFVSRPSELYYFSGSIKRNISSPQLKKMKTGQKKSVVVEVRSFDVRLREDYIVIMDGEKYRVVAYVDMVDGPLPQTIALAEGI